MWEFVSNIFQKRDKKLTILILDKNNPEETPSYQFEPRRLFYVMGGVWVSTILILAGFLWITPMGSILFSNVEEETRQEVIKLSQKFQALQDSLEIRDLQFYEMQQTMASGKDTTFELSMNSQVQPGETKNNRPQIYFDDTETMFNSLSSSEILRTDVFLKPVNFPARVPLDGILTQEFNTKNKHQGIDIAGKEGAGVKSIAGGVVISSEWTLNFGFTITIQHGQNYVSVYKHCADIYVEKGDIVTEGEILGIIGNSGIISSGPHLHFEIWNNGMAVNPMNYLSEI